MLLTAIYTPVKSHNIVQRKNRRLQFKGNARIFSAYNCHKNKNSQPGPENQHCYKKKRVYYICDQLLHLWLQKVRSRGEEYPSSTGPSIFLDNSGRGRSLFSQGMGGDTPGNSWWGCASLFSKSWPFCRPKNVIFRTSFRQKLCCHLLDWSAKKCFFKSISHSHISISFLLIWNWNDRDVHTLLYFPRKPYPIPDQNG